MKIYYWSCPLCEIKEQPASSSSDAWEKIENHEKNEHKNKKVGILGVKFQTGENHEIS